LEAIAPPTFLPVLEHGMRLNHLNLTVTDVEAAADFLTTYFGLTRQGGNAGMTLLTDVPGFDGMILTLMKAKPSTFRGYPETFHIGFYVDDRPEVDRLSARLRGDGFDAGPPEDTGHSYGFYVNAPGGVTVEVGG
jgi:catechol 2,3-dioxygenase-like lactoylglutathione lyase family enzyme